MNKQELVEALLSGNVGHRVWQAGYHRSALEDMTEKELRTLAHEVGACVS